MRHGPANCGRVGAKPAKGLGALEPSVPWARTAAREAFNRLQQLSAVSSSQHEKTFSLGGAVAAAAEHQRAPGSCSFVASTPEQTPVLASGPASSRCEARSELALAQQNP
ncbi:uncharacterized protein B0I36DRAFT_346922 [Microdochium trichocladiopsis]|uniref:Uncharacterized protein n=1 Tax=Microdochium trichocladiopsis TaxID=1682393 RepID=A0A9P8YB77_9PEZI|nr:uncharacterized protein B0I36DRAFT_346922 [Microdochium trichocladiopsis]KAH7035077.1 hypothetical protein B0I36DRAFT_346922 [Microdochium trichocladiopsis]